MPNLINTQTLKETFALRVFASSLFGKSIHHHSYDQYHCPKHSDRSPSLTIYEHSWYCYACGEGGSIFDLLIFYKKLTFKEALEEITNSIEQYPLNSTPITAEPTREIPMQLVQENAQNILKGLEYFNSRGITNPTSYKIPLGVKLNYRSSYQMSDGNWFNVEASRYAVPNIFNGNVRSINYRRDDVAFLEAFFNHPSHSRVMDDLSINYSGSPESNLLDVVAGAKYKQEPGSKWKPFNVDLIAKREEGQTIYIPQPYLLVYAESKEFDVLAAMDAGYPIVGVTYTHELEPVLPKLFEHIPMIYIIADNDEPGMKKAIRLQNILKRGRITSSPVGKDIGDAIAADVLHKWLSGSLGLPKVLNDRL